MDGKLDEASMKANIGKLRKLTELCPCQTGKLTLY